MSAMGIKELALRVNERAGNYRIERLQEHRKEIRGHARMAPGPIFSSRSVHDTYAFHSGGRQELQFNIGTDEGGIRHGVAFSLETSQSLPSLDPLIPKVARFNEYLRSVPTAFDEFRMWHWDTKKGKRSDNRWPTPIVPELAVHNRFIFLGDTQPADSVDVDRVLRDFDQFLDLYLYVESADAVAMDDSQSGNSRPQGFLFRAGHTPYVQSQTSTYTERTLNVRLRHNELQTKIYGILCDEFSPDSVGTELPASFGGEIDFVVESVRGRIFAELKTSGTARACVREAVGQLLDYSYFRETSHPAEIWVIGTGKPTLHDQDYLELMRSTLRIPIYYRCFDETIQVLTPKI